MLPQPHMFLCSDTSGPLGWGGLLGHTTVGFSMCIFNEKHPYIKMWIYGCMHTFLLWTCTLWSSLEIYKAQTIKEDHMHLLNLQ